MRVFKRGRYHGNVPRAPRFPPITTGIILATVALSIWLVVASIRSELTPEKAAKVMRATPEFNCTGTLVAVSDTKKPADSGDPRSTATFTFNPRGSATIVDGKGWFSRRGQNWHLDTLVYGRGPERVTVDTRGATRSQCN